MPFVQAKCTNCGDNLTVDASRDAAICGSCGGAFIVEKAVNHYNTTNHIQAGVVHVYGGNSADFVIRAGVLEKYNGAATEVVVPDGVKVIEAEAFKGCSGLEKVVMSERVQGIGARAFFGCSSLKEIVIPKYVQGIGAQAFEGCSSLEKIVIPESAEQIVGPVFGGCHSLQELIIPPKVLPMSEPEVLCDLEYKKFLGLMDFLFGTYADFSRVPENLWLNGVHIQGLRELHMEEERQGKAQQKAWRDSGRCEYCGGQRSFWADKCKVCGKGKYG
ncbi:MAG: leucine-rich repeat domain-containing protein [Oscillospiraceae bacterium]|nr:leucine-rich repeat domain-containing protein [Oscillospiraceae bacterium]